MWKIHRENKMPGPGIMIGGQLIGAHIVCETPALAEADTQEEAKQIILEMVARGDAQPRDLYAVGCD
jgi:hypothetical protein